MGRFLRHTVQPGTGALLASGDTRWAGYDEWISCGTLELDMLVLHYRQRGAGCLDLGSLCGLRCSLLTSIKIAIRNSTFHGGREGPA